MPGTDAMPGTTSPDAMPSTDVAHGATRGRFPAARHRVALTSHGVDQLQVRVFHVGGAYFMLAARISCW
eukprot:1684809-Rhodomonas_salina.2